MTDLRKAAEMALEALYSANPIGHALEDYEYHNRTTENLRQALAQPEQEPVAYLCENAVGYKYFRWKKPTSYYKPIALFTAAPSKQWVGLTDEEIKQIMQRWRNGYIDIKDVEQLLKGKNT